MSALVQVFGRRNDETDHALKRPATKKRQGTKSRAVGQWLAAGAMGIACQRRVSIVVGMLARRDLHVCRMGGRQSVAGILAGVWIASTRDPCTDGCDWVERDLRRRGAGAFGEGKPQRSPTASGS